MHAVEPGSQPASRIDHVIETFWILNPQAGGILPLANAILALFGCQIAPFAVHQISEAKMSTDGG
jgi:hypothetical protein